MIPALQRENRRTGTGYVATAFRIMSAHEISRKTDAIRTVMHMQISYMLFARSRANTPEAVLLLFARYVI